MNKSTWNLLTASCVLSFSVFIAQAEAARPPAAPSIAEADQSMAACDKPDPAPVCDTPPPPAPVICPCPCPATNPAGSPHVKNGDDWFITVDYLYWQASEQNLTYATNLTSSSVLGTNAPKAKIFSPHFNWNSGFRLGLGYNMKHDEWDARVIWTSLKSTASDSRTETTPLFLISTVDSPDFDVVSFSANTSLTAHLHLLDFELGKEFYATKWLTLRPFASVRTSWLNQSWKSNFFGAGAHWLTPPAFNISNYSVRLKQNFWGVGLRGGLNTEWGLGKGFSIFGNGALSCLYGHFSDSRKETATSLAGVNTTALNGSKKNISEQVITELQLGLRWDKYFSNERYHLGLQAGWEHTVFLDHNRLFYFTETNSDQLSDYGGNMGFQGLTISARFDF